MTASRFLLLRFGDLKLFLESLLRLISLENLFYEALTVLGRKMLGQLELALRQPMIRLLLSLFELLYLAANVELDLNHGDQALIIWTGHQF